MLSDYAATMFAVVIITVATFGMTALAVLFMQWFLEIGEFFVRVPATREENFVVNEAAALTPSHELAGD
jgi:hypothetical protein